MKFNFFKKINNSKINSEQTNNTSPLLVENGLSITQDVNIIEYKDQFYAIHQSYGAVDFSSDIKKIPFLVISDSIEEAKEKLKNKDWSSLNYSASTKSIKEAKEIKNLQMKIGDNFLLNAFGWNINSLVTALLYELEDEEEINIIGSDFLTKKIHSELKVKNRRVNRINFSFDDFNQEGINGILCQTPITLSDWGKCEKFIKTNNVKPIWQITLKYSLFKELGEKYEYNFETFEDLLKVYGGKDFKNYKKGRRNNQLEIISQYINLEGKNILELGPSDGNRTSDLISHKVNSITAVEGRTENILKLLAVKYAFGWDKLKIIFDNFHLSDKWEMDSKYDLAYAQGVYYHCQNPLLFFKNLMKVSDYIFVGGWLATNEMPAVPWLKIEFEDNIYKAKSYQESDHFLSGLGSTSILLTQDEIERFFQERDYECLNHKTVINEGTAFSNIWYEGFFKRTN